MATTISALQRAAEAGLARQDARIDAEIARRIDSVYIQRAAGTGHLDQSFGPASPFRLVHVRCHFVGTSLTGPFILSVDSAAGAAYATRLFTLTQAGPDCDVHFRCLADETQAPAAWAFAAGDQLRLQWTNPDPGQITWGVEVAFAAAL